MKVALGLEKMAAERAELIKRLQAIDRTEMDCLSRHSKTFIREQLITQLDSLDALITGHGVGIAHVLHNHIVREIDLIKYAIERNVAPELLFEELSFLNHKQAKSDFESNIDYIREHSNDSSSRICETLGLVHDLFYESL